jgi:hypothetical protein
VTELVVAWIGLCVGLVAFVAALQALDIID